MKLKRIVLLLVVVLMSSGLFGTQSAKASCEYPWRTYCRFYTIITNGETSTTVTVGEYWEDCDGTVTQWGTTTCGGVVHCGCETTRCEPVCDN